MAKHNIEYILGVIAGILLILNGLLFIAGLSITFPEDDILIRMRSSLGAEQFRLLSIRVIIGSIIGGSMLIILAVAMEKNPKDLLHYGIMMIIVSIMSVIGTGLLYVTSIIIIGIGIASGIIAITKGKKGVVLLEHKYEEVKDMEYLCTICNIEFRSDIELRKHMLKHIEKD